MPHYEIMKPDIVNSEQDPAMRGVGLLHKAMGILELFSAEEPTWTQSDIAKATQLPRSTISRLVRYFVSRGYLSINEDTARYSLGFSAIELGRRAQFQFDLATVAGDVLDALARQTRETIMLTGFNPAALQVVCLDQIPSQHGGLRVFEAIGATFHLYSGASAKSVLAYLPDNIAETILKSPMPPVNPDVPIVPENLRKELVSIRACGYATSYEETYPGVAGIGAAILDPSGYPLGSIAIAAPLQRLGPDVMVAYGKLVATAVGVITLKLKGEETTGLELVEEANG